MAQVEQVMDLVGSGLQLVFDFEINGDRSIHCNAELTLQPIEVIIA